MCCKVQLNKTLTFLISIKTTFCSVAWRNEKLSKKSMVYFCLYCVYKNRNGPLAFFVLLVLGHRAASICPRLLKSMFAKIWNYQVFELWILHWKNVILEDFLKYILWLYNCSVYWWRQFIQPLLNSFRKALRRVDFLNKFY